MLKVKTKFGYEIEGTINHPIVVLERDKNGKPKLRWKTLAKIKPGDYVVINRRVPMDWNDWVFRFNGKDIKINKDWAIILGAFLSDGYVDIDRERKRYRALFVNVDESFVDIVVKSIRNVGYDVKIYKRKLRSGKIEYDVYVLSKEFCEILELLGLRRKSNDIEIPKAILISSKNTQRWFLKTLFEGDGGVNIRRDGISIYYHSSSLKLLKQLQILLLNFGIVSSIKKDRGIYRLIIYTQDVKKFAEEIGFLCTKDKKLREAAFQLYNELSNEGIEVLLDDRDERPGIKFKDADLIGIPIRITIGPRGLKEGKVEVKFRKTGKVEMVSIEEAVDYIKAFLK